ncbi:MAG: arsenate reductase ArsC, partial [Pseudomonadota bacterium]
DQILGPVVEDPHLLHLKKTLPCQCPTCDASLQISYVKEFPPGAVEMSKAKMLFLCTGNAARSQMAEAFMHKYAHNEFEVYSAGLEPRGINPLTVSVMDEVGIDVSQKKSTGIYEYLGQMNFGYLITVCARAEENCPSAFLNSSGQRLDWFFDDPAAVEGSDGEKLAKFREVRDQIDEQIKDWLTQRSQISSQK